MGTEYYNHEPLLSIKEEDDGFNHAKNTPFVLKSSKLVLKFAMWFIFIVWATFLFLLPSQYVNESYKKYVEATSANPFGRTGSVFLVFSGPVFIIVFLGIIYRAISGDEQLREKRKANQASFRLWTLPVIVDGPFGVVTAAELIGIVVFGVYIIWAVVGYTMQNYNLLPLILITDDGQRYLIWLKLTGVRLGFIGLICMAFLFLPVARGSVILRLIDIPFEHATRYHVWLGHLMMLLFALHGLFFVIAWAIQGRLLRELLAWQNSGIANLPGVISLLAGLLMWVTSLPPVRRRINFELFFYTHQLYVVFVVFLAMHVGDFVFSIVSAGIFLFMLDRFLRFFQSRKMVDVLSAKCLPSGTVELVLSKPQNLQYNALGWVFLQVRELSLLQWHPFSVSSSPLDGKHHIAVLIKVLGDWTDKLRGRISSDSEEQAETDRLLQPNLKLTASVEGPYGHESPYYLAYENLILVAGGIGISPFLAILSDILHRIRDSKPCLPRNVAIIWAVKTSDELPLLHSLDIESLCPFFSKTLNLEIQTYVTRESSPPLEEGKTHKYASSYVFPAPSRGGAMSSLVGTGNILWSGAYVVVSTIGLILSVALLHIFYINPYNVSSFWYNGLLLMICMAASVVVFGGFVISLWHLWDRKTSSEKNTEDDENIIFNVQPDDESNIYKISAHENFVNIIKYGERPNFEEIFKSMGERWGNVDIGVMVCGPTALQTSIAKECRSKNFGRSKSEAIFHFNSHTFDL